MKKINIMHLCVGNKLYGAEQVVLSLAKNVNSKKFNSMICCIEDSKEQTAEFVSKAKEMGIKTIKLVMHGRFNPFAILRLKRLIESHKIDILHCHGYKADVIGYLATRQTNIPIISTLHGWVNISKDLKLALYEKLDKFIIKYFDKIIPVSNQILKEFNAKKDKIKIINNGVDIKKFSKGKLRKEFKINNKIKLIGIIGRLSPEKGYEYLFKAAVQIFKKIPDCKIIVIGDGPEKEKLADLANELNLKEKIVFIGFRNDAREFIPNLDVVVMPSLTEGFPNTLLESMAAGKPVVATKVAEIPNVIKHKKNGILIEPKDSKQLAKNIIELLKNLRLRKQIGIQARNTVINNYSIKKMVKEYEKTYSELSKKW